MQDNTYKIAHLREWAVTYTVNILCATPANFSFVFYLLFFHVLCSAGKADKCLQVVERHLFSVK